MNVNELKKELTMQTYDPQSVEFNGVVKVLDEFSPVFTDVWVKIVWKCGVLTVQLKQSKHYR